MLKQVFEVNYIGYTNNLRDFGRITIEVISKEKVIADEQIKKRVKRYLNYDRVELQEPRLVETILQINL